MGRSGQGKGRGGETSGQRGMDTPIGVVSTLPSVIPGFHSGTPLLLIEVLIQPILQRTEGRRGTKKGGGH